MKYPCRTSKISNKADEVAIGNIHSIPPMRKIHDKHEKENRYKDYLISRTRTSILTR